MKVTESFTEHHKNNLKLYDVLRVLYSKKYSHVAVNFNINQYFFSSKKVQKQF